MEFVGSYIGNVASEWITSTVDGAKTAAAAYGGNLAGDAISYGGDLIESAGRSTGNAVAGAFKGYGNWINGYGDKLRGAPPSSLPTSGPMATYKAGGAGSLILKRSSSYGPASSTCKALTRNNSAVAKTDSGALQGTTGKASRAIPKYAKGSSSTKSTARLSVPGSEVASASTKPSGTSATKKHTGAVVKQGTSAKTAATPVASAKPERKSGYPGTFAVKSTQGATATTKRPTPSGSKSGPKPAADAAGKVNLSPASRPRPRSYAPYKDSRVGSVNHGGMKGKDAIR